MSWLCDFSRWDYRGVVVDVYLAAILNPQVKDAPSSVSDALSGGAVYLYGPQMKSMYLYEGKVGKPTWSTIVFPPVPIFGKIRFTAPADPSCMGDYVFAAIFIRRDTGTFVRTDGKPVENSNLFMIT